MSVSCSDHPLVSVVVCTRGLRPSLTACLDSLLEQDCTNFETLLVLNSERDNAFAKALSRYPLRLLNEPRPGVCVARNCAVPQTRGEVLAFLDDDVKAHAGWLHEVLKGFERPQVACVLGRVVPEGPTYLAQERVERFYASERVLSTWTLDPSNPDWYEQIFLGRAGYGCNMAFRRNFLTGCTLFPEDLGAGSLIGAGDDDYMFIQVLKHGFSLHYSPTVVVTHHFDADRASRKFSMAQRYAGATAFWLKMLIEEKGLRLPNLKVLMSAIKRRLRWAMARKTISSEPQELLSPGEKFRAYLGGPLVFWKSRRVKGSARPNPYAEHAPTSGEKP